LLKRLRLEYFSPIGYKSSDAQKIASQIVDDINEDLVIQKPEKSLIIYLTVFWARVTAAAVACSFAVEGAAHHVFKVLPTNQKPLTTTTIVASAFLSPFVQFPIAAGQGAINLGLAGATIAVAGGLFKKARRKDGLIDPPELSNALQDLYRLSTENKYKPLFDEVAHEVAHDIIKDLFNVTGDKTMKDLVARAQKIDGLSLRRDLLDDVLLDDVLLDELSQPKNPEYLRLAEQIRIAAVNAMTCLLILKDPHLSPFLEGIVGKNAADYRKIILEAARIPEVEEWLYENLSAYDSNSLKAWDSIKSAITDRTPLSDAQRTCLLMLPSKSGLPYSLGLAIDLLRDPPLPVRSAIDPTTAAAVDAAAASRPPR